MWVCCSVLQRVAVCGTLRWRRLHWWRLNSYTRVTWRVHTYVAGSWLVHMWVHMCIISFICVLDLRRTQRFDDTTTRGKTKFPFSDSFYQTWSFADRHITNLDIYLIWFLVNQTKHSALTIFFTSLKKFPFSDSCYQIWSFADGHTSYLIHMYVHICMHIYTYIYTYTYKYT